MTSYALFSFENNTQKALLSLFNLTVYLVPLISLIFGTMYFYNSKEYIEMILCQPIKRSSLFIGLFLGTTLPLAISYTAGILLPYFMFSTTANAFNLLLLLLVLGNLMTFISIGSAFLISIKLADKVKGLGLAIFFWLIAAILFDGLLLLLVYLLEDYPVEKFILGLILINPIDLSRTIFMINFDISALMGYTGALFKKFFGSEAGTIISFASLLLWIFTPVWLGLRSFNKKDF